jgi:putative transposase
VKYAFIEGERAYFSVTELCNLLKVSVSGYYAFRKREESSRAKEDKRLGDKVLKLFNESGGTYGSVRLHWALKKMEEKVGRNRVIKLMKKQNLQAKATRKYKATTDSNHGFGVQPNRLEQQFKIDKPNCVYAGDITYIRTQEGWLYLAVVMDLFSRQIIGWSMSNRMTRQLVMDALLSAYWRRKPAKGVIFHSDKGSQYASYDYQFLLQSHGFIASMSGKGNCFDNAVVESFFHTLKVELVHHRNYLTREEAKSDIFNYIEMFYNTKRLHSTLGYCSPVEFEQQYQLAIVA